MSTAVPSIQVTPEGYLIITVHDQEYLYRFCDSHDIGLMGCARFDEHRVPDLWCVVMVIDDPGTVPGEGTYTRQDVIDHELKHCKSGNFHGNPPGSGH